MTRDDVRHLMHDYFDDLLSPDERSSVESYLEAYEDVAKEYELLGKLLEKAETLPIGIKTPDNLIEKVSNALLTVDIKDESLKQQKIKELTENSDQERKKKKKDRPPKKEKVKAPKPKGSVVKRILYIVTFLLIAAGAVFVYFFLDDNFPWNMRVEYGEYQIDGEYTTEKELSHNNTLTTFDSTKVSIFVPNAGKVDVRSYSMLEIVEGKELSNKISLMSGTIIVDSKISEPKLEVKTLPVTIITLSGDYTVTVDPQTNVLVKTNRGEALLKSSNEQLTLIPHHSCRVRSDGNIGIPYHNQAEQELVKLINDVAFNKQTAVDYSPILEIAQHKDGISLLFLLIDAQNEADRKAIFLKLNELFPMPPGITEEGVMSLDKDMVEEWKKDIIWQI